MKKKSIIFLALPLFLINLVSAYYGQTSLENLLNSLDPSTAILGSIFIIFFILINYPLSKAFKDQKGVAVILAFVLSFISIYTINRSGFDYQNIYYNLFYNIGLSSAVASTLLPILFLIGTLIILWKFDMAVLSIILGTLMFLGGILGLVYEGGLLTGIGIVFILIGAYFKFKKKE